MPHSLPFLPVAVAGLLLAASPRHAAAADPAPLSASIAVDASKLQGPVNRLVFGRVLEAADENLDGGPRQAWMDAKVKTGDGFWDVPGNRVVPAIADAAKAAGIGSLRYPGGCLNHGWDWRTCVGPVAERGKGTPVPPGAWTFGLDEFLRGCEALGIEPVLTLSDYVLPAAEMPRHLAELVEYVNAPATEGHPWALKRAAWGHPAPYGVKWFELGNESWHGNHGIRPRRQFTPEEYATYAADSARAMRAVDPSIKLGIVLWNEYDQDWNRVVLQRAGMAADFVIFHVYLPSFGEEPPQPPTDDNLMRATMAAGQQLQRKIDDFRALIRQYAGRDIPLAVTEFNAGFTRKTPEYRFSYGAALESADMERVFLQPENRVLTADYHQFLNGYWGSLTSRADRPDDPQVRERAAGTLLRLWSHFGARLVDVRTQGPTASYASDNTLMYSAQGTEYRPSRLLRTIPLGGGVDFSKLGGGIAGAKADDGTFTLTFDRYQGYRLVSLGEVPLDPPSGEGKVYRLAYEGRLLPDGDAAARPAAMNFVLSDAPGAEAGTHSAQFVGIVAPEWQEFSRYYCPTHPAAHAVYGRFHTQAPFTGRLEVRNLRLEEYSRTVLPAYPLVTASASLSADGKTLYLIVFNKSDAASVRADIALGGFAAASAKRWQANAPALNSTQGARETVSGDPVPVAGPKLSLDLPAHSMTALELYR